MAPHADNEEGTALSVALVFVSLLALTGAAVVQSSSSLAQRVELDSRAGLLTADNAIAKAKTRVLADPAPALGLAAGEQLELFREDGATATLTCLVDADPERVYELQASASPTTIATLLRLRSVSGPLPSVGLAALVGNGEVVLSGNVEVDGRDHAADGFLTGDPGVLGVLSTGDVRPRGNAQIGGVGAEPERHGAPGSIEANSTVWEEGDPTDGVDDDGDGLVDEAGPPADAEALLGRDPGSLKALAQATGTYFTSRDDYEAWRLAASPEVAGGKVVYLELPAGERLTSLQLPDNAVLDRWGATRDPLPQPSVVVATRVGGGLEVGPLHAPEGFQGVAVLDRLRNANGAGSILGMLAVLEPSSHTLGNGALRVHYSSEVLANLPGPTTIELELLEWTRKP